MTAPSPLMVEARRVLLDALERERRVMGPGDSLFIAPGVVHASFNDGTEPVRLFVTLGPCDGEVGYVAEDVSTQEPWASLHASTQ